MASKQTLIALTLFATGVSLMACGAAPQKSAEAPATTAPEPTPVPDTADIEFLFVQGADSASLADGVLTLSGINPQTIFFSDRPERIAGHLPTGEFVNGWGEGKNNFASDPPNATLSILTDEGAHEIVVVLSEPRLEGTELSYNVQVLEGDATASGEACSLFIDIIGMPLTPVSYAGCARRMTRRAFLY